MLKKLSLIVIIAILAYSQVGYYFILRQSQLSHKKEIKKKLRSQLSNHQLDVISLTDNLKKIHWVKPGKEFWFHGEMYDVVRRQVIDGNEIMYCINDKEEKALVDNYNSMTKNNSNSDKQGKSSAQNIITLFVYEDETVSSFFRLVANRFFSYNSSLPRNLVDKISPPPKC